MKKNLMCLLLLTFASCTYATLKYGYYWNPVNILSIASDAIETNNEYDWSDVLANKALCVYGTKQGMANVRSTLEKVDEASLQEPVRTSSKYLKSPQYIGYYTYYQETYQSKALDKYGKELLRVKILCNFGLSENSTKNINLPSIKYTVRSCSIVDIKNFDKPLEVASYCAGL